jgi:hypothetical protein
MRATSVLAALLAAVAVAPAAGGGTSSVRPAWLAPVELTPRADYSITGQDVAVDGSENLLVVWAGTSGVQARYRPAGGAWQAPAQLDACGADAQVAFDGAGQATVLWLGCTPGFTQATTAERRQDGSWTSPVVLSTPGREVGFPHLAVARSGAAIASWGESDGHVWVTQTSVRDPGSDTWTLAAQVSSVGASTDDSSAAIDDRGDAAVGFTREDPSGAIVWAAFRPAGGAWQRAVPLSLPGDYAFDVRVALRPDGTVVALWDENGSGRARDPRDDGNLGGTGDVPDVLGDRPRRGPRR